MNKSILIIILLAFLTSSSVSFLSKLSNLQDLIYELKESFVEIYEEVVTTVKPILNQVERGENKNKEEDKNKEENEKKLYTDSKPQEFIYKKLNQELEKKLKEAKEKGASEEELKKLKADIEKENEIEIRLNLK